MRHALETVQSGGQPIWNGPPIIARNANSSEAAAWSGLKTSSRDSGLDEPNIITVWLIPTLGDQQRGNAP